MSKEGGGGHLKAKKDLSPGCIQVEVDNLQGGTHIHPWGPLATMMQGEYWTNIHPWTPLATTVRGEFWTNIHPSGRPLRQRLAQVTDRGRGHQYGGCSDRCRIICEVGAGQGLGKRLICSVFYKHARPGSNISTLSNVKKTFKLCTHITS